MNIPDIWGEGALFGYPESGETGLHGRLSGNRIALEFDTADRCTLAVDICSISHIKPTVVLPELVQLDCTGSEGSYAVTLAAVSPTAVYIHCDRNADVSVSFSGSARSIPCGDGCVYNCGSKKYALIKLAAGSGAVYGFACGDDCDSEARRVSAMKCTEVADILLEPYRQLQMPEDIAEPYRPLYVRCAALVRQSVSTKLCLGKRANGKFNIDVVSAVMRAVALRDIFPAYAKATVLKVADYISTDGFLPSSLTESCCVNAAPPLICHAFEQICGDDRALVERYYDKLRSCIMYFVDNRDINKDYTYQWRAGSASDPGVESAMPNSPRFDGKVLRSGPDLSAYMYMAALAMGDMSRTISRNSDIIYWGVLAQRIAKGADSLLFDSEKSFYFDRSLIGSRLDTVITTAGFMPLFAGFVPKEYVAGMVSLLDDAAVFGCKRGVPTVARCEETYTQDLYRGSISIGENYKLLCALVKSGYHTKATDVAVRCLDTVRKAYEAEGVLYGYYSSDSRIAHCRQSYFGNSILPMCRTGYEYTRDCPETAAFVAAIFQNFCNLS